MLTDETVAIATIAAALVAPRAALKSRTQATTVPVLSPLTTVSFVLTPAAGAEPPPGLLVLAVGLPCSRPLLLRRPAARGGGPPVPNGGVPPPPTGGGTGAGADVAGGLPALGGPLAAGGGDADPCGPPTPVELAPTPPVAFNPVAFNPVVFNPVVFPPDGGGAVAFRPGGLVVLFPAVLFAAAVRFPEVLLPPAGVLHCAGLLLTTAAADSAEPKTGTDQKISHNRLARGHSL